MSAHLSYTKNSWPCVITYSIFFFSFSHHRHVETMFIILLSEIKHELSFSYDEYLNRMSMCTYKRFSHLYNENSMKTTTTLKWLLFLLWCITSMLISFHLIVMIVSKWCRSKIRWSVGDDNGTRILEDETDSWVCKVKEYDDERHHI